jgi:tRNA threonylcarbamoyladenosine biosynthesis protein TsaE
MKKIFCNVKQSRLDDVAREIISWTTKFSVVAFYAPMGGGKTTLISKLNELLNGSTNEVTSPTFSLVNVYNGNTQIYHFDCYRLEKPEEALNAGLIDMMEDGTLCLVEWPDKIEGLLPEKCIEVHISAGETALERNFEINIPNHD